MTHGEGVERPSTAITDQIQQAQEMVIARRRVIIDEFPLHIRITVICFLAED